MYLAFKTILVATDFGPAASLALDTRERWQTVFMPRSILSISSRNLSRLVSRRCA